MFYRFFFLSWKNERLGKDHYNLWYSISSNLEIEDISRAKIGEKCRIKFFCSKRRFRGNKL